MRGMLHNRGIQAIDCNERRHLRKTAVPVTAQAHFARALTERKARRAAAAAAAIENQTSFLAERLSVGPRPVGLTNTFLGPNNLPARGTGVDGPITQVPSSLMDLSVYRITEELALLLSVVSGRGSAPAD